MKKEFAYGNLGNYWWKVTGEGERGQVKRDK